MQPAVMRRAFWVLNKFFMLPMIRLGLLPFMGTPVGGWMMMLTTTGRRTGKRRLTPVNYAPLAGDVYCLAGFGALAHWYRNLQAHPQVEVLLPSGPLAGVAETVADPAERLRIARLILKNSGFATFLFEGVNPYTIADERLREKMAGWQIVRIRPVGVASGVGDPGGLLWVWWLVALAALLFYSK